MGKTVWLDVFCAQPGEGLLAVKIDYEGVVSSDEFLVRTAEGLARHRGLPAKALEGFRAVFANLDVGVSVGPVKVKPAVATRSRTQLLTETIRSVDEHLPDDATLVIAMDEVPIAIGNVAAREGADAAGQLLQALRELRRRDSKLRWIVCGSVGFHHVLRRCNATEGAVNDLVHLPLGPLADDEASELARRLLLGIARPGGDDVIAALLEETGGIPFLLHALAHRLQDAGTGPLDVAQVRGAFTELLDDRDDSRAVTHFLTRLDPLYGDRVVAARALLDRAAVEGPLTDADDEVLDDLIDDHYLVERGGEVAWRYPVLRRIWAHRRRLG